MPWIDGTTGALPRNRASPYVCASAPLRSAAVRAPSDPKRRQTIVSQNPPPHRRYVRRAAGEAGAPLRLLAGTPTFVTAGCPAPPAGARGGSLTCLACYGHPGVFVYPSHEAIRRARAEGYVARILAGISSED